MLPTDPSYAIPYTVNQAAGGPTRAAYNTQLGSLQSAMQSKQTAPSYEQAVNALSSQYAGHISPQEIGDTLYNIYSQHGPAPGQKYYGGGTNNVQNNTRVYSNGGGGGGGANPYQTSYDSMLPQATPTINSLNSLYNQLYGAVDTTTSNARQNLESTYGGYRNLMSDQFGQAARQLMAGNFARGTGDSSYAADSQTDAGKIYSDQLNNLQSDQNNQEGQLASQALSAKTKYKGMMDMSNNQLNTAQALYGKGDYFNAANMLSGLYNNAVSAIPGLQGDLAAAQPNGELYKSLNNIAPTYSPDQLKSGLSNLIQSSVPKFAKDQIASGLIGSHTTGEPDLNSYWLNYYNSLLNQAV